jgi:hypothetical protein
LRAAIGGPNKQNAARLQLSDCATFSEASARLFEGLQLDAGGEQERIEVDAAVVDPQNEAAEAKNEAEAKNGGATENGSSLDANSQISAAELVVSGKILSDMLSNLNLEDLIRSLAEMSHCDVRLAKSLFVDLFSAIWNQLPERNVSNRTTAAHFFTLSGVMNAPKVGGVFSW